MTTDVDLEEDEDPERPPAPDTPRYIEIVKAGCGGWKDYWGEFDCRHKYPWACEECPIVAERQPDYHQPGEMIQLEDLK